MKKAAILTFEFNYNYGAILQATALKDFICKLGYDVDIVNRGWGDLSSFIKKTKLKDTFSKIVGKFYTLRSILKFKDKHWSLTKGFISESEISEHLKSYDVIIIGSDQIWNSACIDVQGLYYFGCYADPKNQKIVAYAPSFGKNEFKAPLNTISSLKTILSGYKAISVREFEGKELLNRIFGIKDAQCVLDPTMLMDKSYYLKLANIKIKEKKTLAYYILDMTDDKYAFIESFARLNGLTLKNIYLPQKENPLGVIGHLRAIKYPSVESWLNNIANASFVITDSFHGSVFSIIFNKQFYVFGNENRGMSRFNTLLSRFKLENRLVCPSNFDIVSDNIPQIDYHTVNSILEDERFKSIQFLTEALK